jgi:hypothetical protein
MSVSPARHRLLEAIREQRARAFQTLSKRFRIDAADRRGFRGAQPFDTNE